MRERNGNAEGQTVDITVYDYFREKGIELEWSAYVPCLDVGRPNQPSYLPVELCNLVPLQRYTKALSSQQRASLAEKSRLKPRDRIRVITDMVRNNRYDEDPMLSTCQELTHVNGRLLNAPTGTSRPTNYHILLDEIGFSPDDLQNLVHLLSYVCQRSTSAVSIAAQMSKFIKFEAFSEACSGNVMDEGVPPFPELPPLHDNVKNSMFF